MLKPGLPLVRKNNSPTEQVGGRLMPAFRGLVEVEPEKSIDLLWVFRSTLVCAVVCEALNASIQPNTTTRIFIGTQDLVRIGGDRRPTAAFGSDFIRRWEELAG